MTKHSDPLDFASDLEERERVHARTLRRPELVRNGYCHHCEAELANPEAAFCDKDCSDGWEREQKRQRSGWR